MLIGARTLLLLGGVPTGLILPGPNLITNGTFDADANWTKGAGWTISGGTANSSGSGTLQYTAGVPFVNGATYRVSFDVVTVTVGGFRFQMTGGTVVTGTTRTTTGTFTQDVVALSNTGFQISLTSAGQGTIDDIDVHRIA